MTELEKKIEQGNKRLALVCCVWTLIFSIPLFFLINKPYWTAIIMSYMGVVIIGVLLSPKIVNLIWKK